jgi:hypothetical protein
LSALLCPLRSLHDFLLRCLSLPFPWHPAHARLLLMPFLYAR